MIFCNQSERALGAAINLHINQFIFRCFHTFLVISIYSHWFISFEFPHFSYQWFKITQKYLTLHQIQQILLQRSSFDHIFIEQVAIVLFLFIFIFGDSFLLFSVFGYPHCFLVLNSDSLARSIYVICRAINNWMTTFHDSILYQILLGESTMNHKSGDFNNISMYTFWQSKWRKWHHSHSRNRLKLKMHNNE